MNEPSAFDFLAGASAEGSAVWLRGRMANRHGLIAGATGTGKTVTLQVLAEQFSRAGVPVFTADVKGDLSGIGMPAEPNEKLTARAAAVGLPQFHAQGCPVVFWDLDGERGHPVRTTVSEMGPLLLGRLLELTDAQSDLLQLIFKIADDRGLLLVDLKDLSAVCGWAADNAASLRDTYGGFSSQTVGALQRKLVVLGDQGGSTFFGEPALTIDVLMRTDRHGEGIVHVLDARTLISNPRRYATFMLWLLSELFEDLDEVGDAEKPRLVFFFDEAHLLFQDAPESLVRKIEQVVRLVRSKGVGIYFVTQNPLDLPDSVLGQLGNRFQHALRAFSVRDQKAVRAAAETFPLREGLDIGTAITELGVGETLASCLDEKGRPTPTERIMVAPPSSRIGPMTDAERRERLATSPFAGVYDRAVDRESAYETLKRSVEKRVESETPPPLPKESRPAPVPKAPAARRSDTVWEALGKSVMRSAGSSLGRELTRGLLGGILGTTKRRR